MNHLELSPEQTAELKSLSNLAPGRVAQRALAVLWFNEGLTTMEIGDLLGFGRAQTAAWIDRYLLLGLAGLQDETLPTGAFSVDSPLPVREAGSGI
jgi:hypothetical protein